MLALAAIYGWTIGAGCAVSSVLALVGVQLATRDRAMQTICVGQGALVGVLLGLGLFQPFDIPFLTSVGPMTLALVFSGATYLLTDRWVASRAASKNTLFAVLFASLLSSGYLISSIFPALENHLAQVYFGDLATLTELGSKISLGLSIVALFLLVRNWASFSNESFEWALFGCPPSTRKLTSPWVFRFLSLLVLSISVQYVGFLFTTAMLFIPTGLLSLSKIQGLRRHLVLSVVLAVSSSVIGFLISLVFTRLPTVPTIVAVLVLSGVVVLGIEPIWVDLVKNRGLDLRTAISSLRWKRSQQPS